MTTKADAESTRAFPKVKDPRGEVFWVGLTKDCPNFATTIAGITFQQETFAIQRDGLGNPLTDNRTGTTKVRDRDGNLARITPEQMKRIQKVVEDMVIQIRSLPDLTNANGQVVETNRIRARIIRRSSSRYLPVQDEEPLGAYLYIRPPEERGKFDGSRPPCVGD